MSIELLNVDQLTEGTAEKKKKCPTCGQMVPVLKSEQGNDVFDYHPDPDDDTLECQRSGLLV